MSISLGVRNFWTDQAHLVHMHFEPGGLGKESGSDKNFSMTDIILVETGSD